MAAKSLDEIFNVPFTFSANCRKGVLPDMEAGRQCQCRRCRQERGEPVTEESERIAKEQAMEADEWSRRLIREVFGKPPEGGAP